MQLPSYMLAGLATSVAATKLYVSDYSTAEIPGNVTSFSLSAQPKGSPYLIERISSTQSPTYQPSWLTKNPENDILYLANEFFAGVNGTISTFKTSSDGQLSLVQNILTKNGPVHTSIYNQGKALVSAEYAGSSVTSWTINSNGSLTPSQSFTWSIDKKKVPRPHETIIDPTGSYIVVPDLGSDLLRVFSIDNTTSLLTEQTSYPLANDTGPRHGAFLKTKCGQTFLFVVNEFKPIVASYRVTYPGNSYGNKSLTISPIATYPILGPDNVNRTGPADTDGHYAPYAAEAIVSPCGKFLLTSSRGDNLSKARNPDPRNSTMIVSDSLQAWTINQSTGALTFEQLAPAGGSWPRQFSMNKNGTLVAVVLEVGARVSIIARTDKGLFGEIVANVSVGTGGTGVGPSSVVWDE